MKYTQSVLYPWQSSAIQGKLQSPGWYEEKANTQLHSSWPPCLTEKERGKKSQEMLPRKQPRDSSPCKCNQINTEHCPSPKTCHCINRWKWKLHSHLQLFGKGQFSFQSLRKAVPKNAQTTTKLHPSHTLLKPNRDQPSVTPWTSAHQTPRPVEECSKFSKPGFNSMWTVNLQRFKLDLEKAE